MGDRNLANDLEQLRLREPEHPWKSSEGGGGGVPAFLGQVTTATSKIAVGEFVMVQPYTVLGTEVEGGTGQFTEVSTATVPVYLVGPAAPVTGDYLVCRYVDNRWAADRTAVGTSGGSTATIPNCYCDPIPTSMTMTSLSSTCNYGMFQSCSILYGPTPADYTGLGLGLNAWLSAQSFPDKLAGGAMFQYVLTCSYNQFNLSRVYVTSPYGSPYRDGVLYSWLISGYGNSCSPFHLDNGNAYVGSDASCFVMIDVA